MNPKDFKPSAWAQLVRSIGGVDACIPRNLPPDIAWNPPLLSMLSAADRALGQLAGIARTLPNPRLLIRTFINREAVLSSKIEGTKTTLEELFLFEINPEVEEKRPDVREVSPPAPLVSSATLRPEGEGCKAPTSARASSTSAFRTSRSNRSPTTPTSAKA